MDQPVKPHQVSCNPDLSAIDDALFVIHGKWTLKVIVALIDEAKRFNELRRALGGISARVLSNELRNLEQNGIVKRTIIGHSPIEVAYELTHYSHSLREVVRALGQWGLEHRAAIREIG